MHKVRAMCTDASWILILHVCVFTVDLDIQGQELGVLTDAETVKLLHEKVYAIHIGTHSPYIHSILRQFFLHMGWVPEMDYEHNTDMDRCDG